LDGFQKGHEKTAWLAASACGKLEALYEKLNSKVESFTNPLIEN